MHNAQPASPSPETPRQLRQWVVDRLRSDIVRGQIPSGEWLRQEKLARELGVSQTPVREALKQLAAEGLLQYEPYRGIRVVDFTAEDVEDVYAGRVASEGRAAGFAAKLITAAELDELRAIQAEIVVCEMPRELSHYRELNRRFHLAIIRASHRPYLIRALTQLWETFPTMLWGSVPDTAESSAPGRDAPDILEHEALLAALTARDPKAAEQALKRHIESSGQALAAAIRARRR